MTATRLHAKNWMFAEAFRAIAVLLTLYEVDKDGWHHADIIGHTKASKLFPFTMAEAALLWEWDVIVVSQLFSMSDLTGMLDRTENTALTVRLQQFPLLRHKLHLLRTQLCKNNFLNKTSVAVTTLSLLFRKDQNISQSLKSFLSTTCTCLRNFHPLSVHGKGMGCMFLNSKPLKMRFMSFPSPFYHPKQKRLPSKF
jgi:hypothetical protein